MATQVLKFAFLAGVVQHIRRLEHGALIRLGAWYTVRRVPVAPRRRVLSRGAGSTISEHCECGRVLCVALRPSSGLDVQVPRNKQSRSNLTKCLMTGRSWCMAFSFFANQRISTQERLVCCPRKLPDVHGCRRSGIKVRGALIAHRKRTQIIAIVHSSTFFVPSPTPTHCIRSLSPADGSAGAQMEEQGPRVTDDDDENGKEEDDIKEEDGTPAGATLHQPT